MADFQVIISGQIFKLIPSGFCACGCGGKTTIPRVSNASKKWLANRPLKFMNGHHGKGLKRELSPNWGWGKGNGYRQINGYVMRRMMGHPRADAYGHVLEHILVVEKAMGKFLPLNAVPHHVDENKLNNVPSNLVVCQDRAYHNLLHRRMRALAACGHANWRKCGYCHEYDDPKNMYINAKHFDAFHQSCKNEYRRKKAINGPKL